MFGEGVWKELHEILKVFYSNCSSLLCMQYGMFKCVHII